MEATAGFEPAIGVLQTPALPLGYVTLTSGAEDKIRTRDPLLGKEMFYRRAASALTAHSAEGQNRTADTMIFSHVLYQLSYLGSSAQYSTLYPLACQGKLHEDAKGGEPSAPRLSQSFSLL